MDTNDAQSENSNVDNGQTLDTPVLLVPIGEAAAVTLGMGKGSAEDKRRAYN